MEPPPPDLAKIPSIMESSTLLSVFDNDPVTGEQTLASLESGGEAPHFIPRFDSQPLPDLGPEDLIEISSPEVPGTVSCQDSGTEESLTVPEPQPGKRRGEPDFSHVFKVWENRRDKCDRPPARKRQWKRRTIPLGVIRTRRMRKLDSKRSKDRSEIFAVPDATEPDATEADATEADATELNATEPYSTEPEDQETQCQMNRPDPNFAHQRLPHHIPV